MSAGSSVARGIVTLFGAAVASVPGLQPLGIAIALGGNLAIGADDARKLRRQIEQNKQQRDLSLTLPTAPRRRVYGRDRVPGALRYWTTHGDEQRFLSLVYVFADHPCDAIEDIHVDDKSLGPFDGNGYVVYGSPWWKETSGGLTSDYLAATAGVITLPFAAVATPTVSIKGKWWDYPVPADEDWYQPAEAFWPLPASKFSTGSLPSSTITLLGELAGKTIPQDDIVVNWTTSIGKSLARVRYYTGAVPQTADATLITDSGGEWTSACRLDGQTYAIVTFEWDETTAANGIPTVYAVLRGARVYDPRTSTTAWSDNWALCIRDYIKYASNCADSEINDDSVIESANIADQTVTVDDGTIKRYTINGSIESTIAPVEALQDMALAGGGTITWSAGKFRVLAGAYRTPVSITLSDADLAGGYQYQGEVPREDRFNTVVGVFRDARVVGGIPLYTRTDYASYKSAAYVTEDNGEGIERRIDLPYCTDYRTANRIAKQIMRRARQGARITALWKLKALPLQVGDVVTVSLARLGVSSKAFEVVSAQYQFPGAVELVLQETASAVYDWTYTEVAYLDPAPNTLLPSPTAVDTPVLTVTCTATAPATIKTAGDGSQIPYARVSWPARASASEYVEIRWKRATETGYRTLAARPGELSIDIEGISGGDVLQIIGVAVNGIGARSAPWLIQQYDVDADLPSYAGYLPALSANLLTNPTFEVSGASWSTLDYNITAGTTVIVHRTDAVSRVAGNPSSLSFEIRSALTGDGKDGSIVSRSVSVLPGQRYVAYASLISYATSAYIAIAWADVSGATIYNDFSPSIAETHVASGGVWNKPEAYQRVSVSAIAPTGAVTARVFIGGAGNWTADPIKYVSVYQPFFGRVPVGSIGLPPWDSGANNVVGTELIENNAVTSVYRTLLVDPGVITWRGPQVFDFGDQLPTVTIPANADIPDGARLRVHISGGAAVRRLTAVVSPITLKNFQAQFVVTDSRTGDIYPAGVLFDLHYATEPTLTNIDLSGTTSYVIEFTHVAGVARSFTVGLQLSTAENGALNITQSAWQITRLGNTSMIVDALKTVR